MSSFYVNPDDLKRIAEDSGLPLRKVKEMII